MATTDATPTARPAAASRESTGSRGVSSNRTLTTAFKTAIAAAAGIFALYPLLYIFSAAINPSNTLSTSSLVPAGASFANFQNMIDNPTGQYPWLTWMLNSVIVSGISAVITVAFTSIAAYAFSRFQWPGRRASLLSLLLIQMFPNMLSLVALFLLLQQIGNLPGIGQFFGLNTHGGLILIYSGGALGFNTWLMKGFFDSIPKELDESAQIDGASPFQTFWQIILPLARPILAVIAILSFIGTYSDFLLARVMLQDSDKFTLAVGMAQFIRGSYNSQWGAFAAAALVGAVPIIAVFLILQKQLIGGLASGAVKG